jgi:hypothetical protein
LIGRYLATAVSSGSTISVFQMPYHNIIHPPTSSLRRGHFPLCVLITALNAFLLHPIRATDHICLTFLDSVILIIFVKSTIYEACHCDHSPAYSTYILSLSLCFFLSLFLSLSLSLSVMSKYSLALWFQATSIYILPFLFECTFHM